MKKLPTKIHFLQNLFFSICVFSSFFANNARTTKLGVLVAGICRLVSCLSWLFTFLDVHIVTQTHFVISAPGYNHNPGGNDDCRRQYFHVFNIVCHSYPCKDAFCKVICSGLWRHKQCRACNRNKKKDRNLCKFLTSLL